MFVQANHYQNNQANQRNAIQRFNQKRGDILVAGQPVTGSKATSGAYRYQRTYTQGPLYAPVTGYSSQIYGNTLIEGVEDAILNGTDSRLARYPLWNAITRQQVAAGNVKTTIDPKAQQAAFSGLGSARGAVAAIDPSTGAILALASTPSYDPSLIAGSDRAAQQKWTSLNNDPATPMLNRALRQTYPPGSTFKIVTASAALDKGVVTDVNAATTSPNPYTPPDTDHPITNESTQDACTDATLMYALQVSCNTVFAKLGDEVGEQDMVRTAQAYGFDDGGLTIPVGVSKSVFPTGLTSQAFLALSSIGQYDTAATPLQMAMVAAAVANGGTLMKPHLVSELDRSDGTAIERFAPETYSHPIDSTVAGELQDMMVNVVAKGTGTSAQIPGVTVGGKTGTAQNGVDNSGKPYAWFISWARPSGASSSPVAVAVVIEDSNAARADVSGGGLAAPIARSVMQAVLSG
ncbi:penicillin-binding transpeptidase domain-containing protein [Phaeacidiphilus oryzae]|uniref:penicillin-binding transpeptidase domain-containing protein n=1 Tax=Phaeacidiphilus oryzae TaxID=348818 RepID=UPI001F2376A0|nr:penicillin-binding transpeptidase domain-containing protein [Phaeacidiphilus oryzae]